MNENSRQFELDEEILASHGQRFVNYLIDYICHFIMMFGVFVIIVFVAMSYGNKDIMVQIEAVSDVIKYAFVSAIILIYYNFFEILFSITIGKLITNTVVVDRNGNKPQMDEILVRSICRLIPFEILSFLGLPGKGWHDAISKTYVVKRKVLEDRKRQFNIQNNQKS